jgi:thiol:disulfide interchange protein DsbC
MKSLRFAAALTLAAALLAPAAQANDTIRKVIEDKFDMKVEKITRTEHMGLYEVYAGGQIIYTDEKATTFFVGNIFDAKSGANLTGKRLISMLPLDHAVKQVRGNGKGFLVTFEDPNCGYCKKLARDIQKLNNVTVYTFVVPILGEDSVAKTKAIMCSADRVKSWNDWMINNVKPADARAGCEPNIERVMDAAQGFQVSGTPTIVFSDGSKAPGAIPLADIEKRLAAIAKKSG